MCTSSSAYELNHEYAK